MRSIFLSENDESGLVTGYHSRVNRKPFKALLFAVRFKFVLNIVIKYSFKHYYA